MPTSAMDSRNTLRARLEELAQNLWWCWNPDAFALFRDLDPTRWAECNHNPTSFLAGISDETLADRARSLALESRVGATFRRLDEYLSDRRTWGGQHAGLLRARPVAYFSAEFGLHESLPLYSGGLGVLAGDHLKAASDLGVPLVGVGIFYVQGYFHQFLDATWRQKERFGQVDPSDLPVQRLTEPDGSPMTITFPGGDVDVKAAIWKVRVGRASLILLDTDVAGNPSEWRDVTHRLYWGDNACRIRQEVVLGIGGLRALHRLGIQPTVLHMNEGHSAFVLLEAIRSEMHVNGLSFEEAREAVGQRSLFTTHTPVPAGHDRFEIPLVEAHLGRIRRDLGLSIPDFMELGIDPSSDDARFCMTVLALGLAHRANAVSSVHGEVSRTMWAGLWSGRPAHEVPIGHITNGVHVGSWMAEPMIRLLDRRLAPGWEERLCDPSGDDEIKELPDDEVWETRGILKARLVDYVRRCYAAQERSRGRSEIAIASELSSLLDPRALTFGFARRFATYKRATLLLGDRDRLASLFQNPDRPVQFIFSGKAHPADEGGKDLIQQIARLQQEEPFKGRLIFVEDYDINVARHLVQGVDVWVNNPRRPQEACGTSGMKVVLNGGLNCSILDGWWAEAYDGMNGFAVDTAGPAKDVALQDHRDREALFSVLEQEVIPEFYHRDAHGLPRHWIDRMKWALTTLGGRYSARRMVRDYATLFYLRAAHGATAERR